MITDIRNLDDLSYILYNKSMNGLKNCIEVIDEANTIYNKEKNNIHSNPLTLRNKINSLHKIFQSYAIDKHLSQKLRLKQS